MRYTRLEMAGDTSIEHTVEGDYEEVLVFFLEMEKKEPVKIKEFTVDWASKLNQQYMNTVSNNTNI